MFDQPKSYVMRQSNRRTIFWILLCILITGCAPKQDMKEELRQLLRDEPELVLGVLKEHDQEVLQSLRLAEANEEIHAARAKMIHEAEHPLAVEINASAPHAGPLNAPNTLIVYADFMCPFCKEGQTAVDKYIARAGEDNILFMPHFFGSDQTSYLLAMCYEALALQPDIDPELPHAFRKRIFAHQGVLRKNPEVLDRIIKEIGADIDRLNADMKSEEVKTRVLATYEDVRRLGFDGTPGYIINGISYVGYLDASKIEDIAAMSKLFAEGGKASILPQVERLYPLVEDVAEETVPQKCESDR